MWFVVRVKANAERHVAQALTGRGHNVFLPLQKRLSKQRGRGLIEIPLFPGYLFAQFERSDLLSVVVCPGVACVLCRGNTPEPVDPAEMNALLTIVRSDLHLEPMSTFTVGQKVTLSRGPLANLEAIVLRHECRSRIVVSISLLQRSVFAEVDRDWLYGVEAERTGPMAQWLPAA